MFPTMYKNVFNDNEMTINLDVSRTIYGTTDILF